MRQQNTLIMSGIPEPSGGSGAGDTGRPTKGSKSKYGTASGKPPFGGDDTLEEMFREIIKHKQKKSFVLEYYKERIAVLIKEDMDK